MVYAIRRGSRTGLFSSWNECAKYVIGFPNAEYKKCKTFEEANEYLGVVERKKGTGLTAVVEPEPVKDTKEIYKNIPQHMLMENEAVAYIGDSFKDEISGSAVVFVTRDAKNVLKGASVGNADVLKQQSIAPKVLSVVMAIHEAESRGIKKLTLVYDYFGIQEWARGTWSTKTKLSQRYYEFIKEHTKSMDIDFVWLKANSSKTKYPFAHLAEDAAKQAVEGYAQCSIADMVLKFLEEPNIATENKTAIVTAETEENSDVPF